MSELSRKLGPALAFLWVFLATIQVKIDGVEATLPYFRFAIFAALPFALFYVIRALLAARLTVSQWIALFGVGYLMLYPILTLFFGPLDVRALKDAVYTLAIYAILFVLLRAWFTDEDGHLDVQRLGRVWVAFAMVESLVALAVWLGVPVYATPATRVVQQVWLDGRLHGVMGTSSHLAPVVAIAGLFVIRQGRNAVNTMVLGVLLVTLIMTGSRGALLGFLGALGIVLPLWASRMRLHVKGVVQLAALFLLIVGVAAYFAEQSLEIVQTAVRVDPADWEKSRSAMWSARLSEFEDRGLIAQLFGAGHRSISQTFNANVEYLVNLGLVYALLANVFFLAVISRFFFRAWAYGTSSDILLLTIAVFTYLFSQGINYTFYKFVHVSQLAMVLLVVSYFERGSAVGILLSRQRARRVRPAVGEPVRAL